MYDGVAIHCCLSLLRDEHVNIKVANRQTLGAKVRFGAVALFPGALNACCGNIL